MRNVTVFALGAAALAFTISAAAQKPVVYPAKGQSAQQQKKDDGACYSWAKSNTGIDPAVVAQTPPPPSGPAVGGGERLKGAARGAIVGEVAGGHGGEGAAAGALVGGARARRNQAAQQQQAQDQKSQAMDTFHRAYGACMEGRGYTVK
jgi:hypothetical protein